MNRRIVFLNLALVALAGALVWILRANWLEAQARERAILQRKVAPRPVLVPPSAPAVKAAAPADYIEVASKMLFSKDRNPTVVVEPPKPAPEPVMPALPNYHGQMAIGEPVILLSTANGVQRSYQVGDQIGDFKIVGFNRDTAEFEWKGKSVERKLEDLRPKQTLAQATPAPAGGPTAASAPARSVASLDRPNAAAAAAASPAASAAAAPAAGKPVTSLNGSSTANTANTASDSDTAGDNVFGPLLPGGVRSCLDSDNSPAGTIHSGYRKNQSMSIFGSLCSWEQVK